MSNMDVIREFWKTWNEEGLAALVARYDDFFTEDLDWRPPVGEMTGPYVGRGGFAQYVTDLEAFGDTRGDLEEIAEIAPDVVLSRVRFHAQGKASGVDVDAPLIGISRLRDGRMYWVWGSYNLAAAERVVDAIARGEEVSV